MNLLMVEVLLSMLIRLDDIRINNIEKDILDESWKLIDVVIRSRMRLVGESDLKVLREFISIVAEYLSSMTDERQSDVYYGDKKIIELLLDIYGVIYSLSLNP